jgi:hypothetical protein
MNGHNDFMYGVDFTYNWKGTRFDEAREWCWETFGASTELDIWEEKDGPTDVRNDKWAWDRGQYNKTFRCIIYLKSDQECNWFKLRWGLE